MTAVAVSQTSRLSGEVFSRWRFAKPFFVIVMVIYLLVPLKYLPGFITERLGADAVAATMAVAAVCSVVIGVVNGIINILFSDVVLFTALRIIGTDIAFRDVGPVLRRPFFVFGCGTLGVAAYIASGNGWEIYMTALPNVIVGLTMVLHAAELYRSLSTWGLSGRGRRCGAVLIYCAIPAIVLGGFLLAPHWFFPDSLAIFY